MIKLMIVDDELVIRRGIKNTIEWAQYDIEIIGEAVNGKEGLTRALEWKPDIILTDIMMPVMDGLELASKIKESLPRTKVVILTGYDYSDYARQAIKLGVKDFLLKPVGEKNLTEAVIRLSEEIILEKQQFNRQLSKSMIYNENLHYIKSRYLLSLLTGKSNIDESFYKNASMLNIELTGPLFQVLLIGADTFLSSPADPAVTDKELTMKAVFNIIDEVLNTYFSSIVIIDDEGRLAAIANISDVSDIAHQASKAFQASINQYLKISVTIGIGSVCKDIQDISKSYQDALLAYKHKLYKIQNSIIQCHDVKESLGAITVTEYETQILTAIKSRQFDDLIQINELLFQGFIQAKPTYEQIKGICIKLVYVAVTAMEDTGMLEKPLTDSIHPYDFGIFETIAEIKEWMRNGFETLIRLAEEKSGGKHKRIVRAAIEFVNKNYKEEMRVEEIANQLYITPNYFSKIFKEGAGQNFVDFLNHVRISKAKMLLRDTNLKTSEIAELVGYNDYKYFNYSFKKYAGCSPKEYRNQQL